MFGHTAVVYVHYSVYNPWGHLLCFLAHAMHTLIKLIYQVALSIVYVAAVKAFILFFVFDSVSLLIA